MLSNRNNRPLADLSPDLSPDSRTGRTGTALTGPSSPDHRVNSCRRIWPGYGRLMVR